MDLELPPADRTMPGSFTAYLADDQQFRAGLLRHIGMEEKILLLAVQRLNRAPRFR